MMIPRPQKSDRLVRKHERRIARRTSPVRNAAGALLPKPEVWHLAAYQAWTKKRYGCGIKGRNGHVCGPRIDGKPVLNFAHAEPEARGLKSSDYFGVVLCADAHRLLTETSWGEFQAQFEFDRDATARRIFESSPWAGKIEVDWT